MQEVKELSPLSARDQKMALMEAMGKTTAELREHFELSPQRLYVIRSKHEYRVLVAELRREVRDRTIESQSEELIKRFNELAPGAIDTIEDVMFGAEKEGDRLKAAEMVLDRAPDAPKSVRREESQTEEIVKIMFGVQNVEAMKAALEDIGDEDVVDLIEYTVEAEGEIIAKRVEDLEDD